MTSSGARPLPAAAPRGRATVVTLWTVQILLSAFFVLGAALPKLLGAQATVDAFDEIGVGQWFRYLVGALELAGGVGLLIPRLAGLAALGLAGVMVGATFTQIVVYDAPAAALFPAALAVIFGLLARAHWPQIRALLSREH